jgi:hypothetical protein
MDLIRDSITRYSAGGKVGARGEMKCLLPGQGDVISGKATMEGMTWQIYYTK